eukprot:scaffold54746_cov60-Phaeocystis_antarctica.AAC.1
MTARPYHAATGRLKRLRFFFKVSAWSSPGPRPRILPVGCGSERWHQRDGLSPCCPAVGAPPRVRVRVTVRAMAMARAGAGKAEAVRTSAALPEEKEAEMGLELTAVTRVAAARAVARAAAEKVAVVRAAARAEAARAAAAKAAARAAE